MSTFNSISDRALDLANSVGDNLKHAVPHAGKWLEAGAKLGALKGGARVAGMFVRRNPAIAIATAAGAGLLWYAALVCTARKRPARKRTTRRANTTTSAS